MMYRQGDVLVESVACIPSDARVVQVKTERIVLVHGESTGHAHTVPSRGVQLLERTAPSETDEKFLRIMEKAGAGLEHQEHATITIPPGTYRVTRQREYAGSDMAPLPVRD